MQPSTTVTQVILPALSDVPNSIPFRVCLVMLDTVLYFHIVAWTNILLTNKLHVADTTHYTHLLFVKKR